MCLYANPKIYIVYLDRANNNTYAIKKRWRENDFASSQHRGDISGPIRVCTRPRLKVECDACLYIYIIRRNLSDGRVRIDQEEVRRMNASDGRKREDIKRNRCGRARYSFTFDALPALTLRF